MCSESSSHSPSTIKNFPFDSNFQKIWKNRTIQSNKKKCRRKNRSFQFHLSKFKLLGNLQILVSSSMPIGSMATAVDPHHCLRVFDAIPISSLSIRASCSSGNDGGLGTRVSAIRRRSSSLELSSSFVGGNLNGCGFGRRRQERRRRKRGNLVVVCEIAGQYEDNFRDIDAQMVNYFTYKAVRTVLHQLYEMNPPSYMWFYNYVATNDMNNSKRFLRKLVKEKQDLAERVMITRLHLYGKWIKKCDHAKMYQLISDENTNLMRERLMETVIWPSDDEP